jgi:hypothetical protein
MITVAVPIAFSEEIEMSKAALALGVACVLALPSAFMAQAQTVRSELENHPRIAKAIREMEDAIAYLQAAPHDFGGHKVAAIRDTRAAIEELRRAMAYRARMDR